MNKKKIIPTTILFFAIVAAVVVFKSIFGDVNTLVGVAGITAALSLLGTDYTINPIKSTIYFVLIELLLGVSSFLSSTNAFLGLVITFIVIFFILHEFTYNTKKPTYVAFALGYFFMLYTPVNNEELPTRLAALAFCGLAIMAVQMIVNRNSIQKQSISTIKKSIELINEQINIIIEKDNKSEIIKINTQVNSLVKNFIVSIYNRLDNDIELPNSLNQALFICQFLENINITLLEIVDNTINSEHITHLIDLKSLLFDIDAFYSNDLSKDTIIAKLDKFIVENDEFTSKYYSIYKFNYYISLLKEDLLLSKDKLTKRISEEYSITNIVNSFSKFKYNLSKDSLKFTFAFRGALVTSLGVFIVALIDIPNGKWLLFSLISVVQPYLESSKKKGKERILGTLIGLVIFEILFTIVTDNTSRALIILLTGYISNYQTAYKYQMVCTTISSLGAASIGSNINDLAFLRISLVLIGTIIALYANRIILPYKASEVTKKEVAKSINLNKKLIDTLYNIGLVNGKINDNFKVTIVENIMLNKTIDFNNNTLLSDDIDSFIYNQRIFTHKLNFLINNSKCYFNKESHNFDLFYNIDMTLNKNIPTNEIISLLNRTNNSYARLILIDALELKKNIETSITIADSIYKNI